MSSSSGWRSSLTTYSKRLCTSNHAIPHSHLDPIRTTIGKHTVSLKTTPFSESTKPHFSFVYVKNYAVNVLLVFSNSVAQSSRTLTLQTNASTNGIEATSEHFPDVTKRSISEEITKFVLRLQLYHHSFSLYPCRPQSSIAANPPSSLSQAHCDLPANRFIDLNFHRQR